MEKKINFEEEIKKLNYDDFIKFACTHLTLEYCENRDNIFSLVAKLNEFFNEKSVEKNNWEENIFKFVFRYNILSTLLKMRKLEKNKSDTHEIINLIIKNTNDLVEYIRAVE